MAVPEAGMDAGASPGLPRDNRPGTTAADDGRRAPLDGIPASGARAIERIAILEEEEMRQG